MIGCVLYWGWGDRLSTCQVPWLRQQQPRVLRRKRDCTLALFLTTSTGTSATSPCTSEEEGLHLRPSAQQRRVPRRRKDCTSGPPPHTNGEHIGGGGTGLLLTTTVSTLCSPGRAYVKFTVPEVVESSIAKPSESHFLFFGVPENVFLRQA